MQFLLEGSDVALTANLYRPTIGILFGSVMAVFNSAEAVPAFFFFSLIVVLAIAGLIAIGTRIGLMLRFVGHALRGTSRRFTLAGGGKRPDARFTCSSVLIIGCLLCPSVSRSTSRHSDAMRRIAIAGYRNGDPRRVVAGRISSDCAVLLAARLEERGLLAVAGLVSFLAPFILDSLLQRHYHTYNNAFAAFYCVVHDATRFWTSSCDEMYRRQGVTGDDVIRDYVHFIVSLPGMRFLLSGFIERVRHDLGVARAPGLRGGSHVGRAGKYSIRVAVASKSQQVLSSRSYWAQWQSSSGRYGSRLSPSSPLYSRLCSAQA